MVYPKAAQSFVMQDDMAFAGKNPAENTNSKAVKLIRRD